MWPLLAFAGVTSAAGIAAARDDAVAASVESLGATSSRWLRRASWVAAAASSRRVCAEGCKGSLGGQACSVLKGVRRAQEKRVFVVAASKVVQRTPRQRPASVWGVAQEHRVSGDGQRHWLGSTSQTRPSNRLAARRDLKNRQETKTGLFCPLVWVSSVLPHTLATMGSSFGLTRRQTHSKRR